MMHEKIEDVAFELADRLRAARENLSGSDDLTATVARLLEAEGKTPTDALAALSFCTSLIAATNLETFSIETRYNFADTAMLLLGKAVDILERHTGHSMHQFLGYADPGKRH